MPTGCQAKYLLIKAKMQNCDVYHVIDGFELLSKSNIKLYKQHYKNAIKC